jgi:hypothetical protein
VRGFLCFRPLHTAVFRLYCHHVAATVLALQLLVRTVIFNLKLSLPLRFLSLSSAFSLSSVERKSADRQGGRDDKELQPIPGTNSPMNVRSPARPDRCSLSLKPRTSPLSSATIREATSSCAGRVIRPDDPFSQRESFVYESCNVCFVIFDLPREQSTVPKASST